MANNHTWCEQLTSLDSRLESVNMGQGGYGVDQAYLWYMRDGVKLQHNIHLFAFIADDFERMKNSTFLGYGKPVIDLENNEIVVQNVPVPKTSYYIPRLTESINKLKKFRLFSMFTDIYLAAIPSESINNSIGDDHIREVSSKLFERLDQAHKMKGSLLVLVFLPFRTDHFERSSDVWRGWLNTFTNEKGIIFIDLVEPFKKLPWKEVVPMFRGHYSEAGNQFIADSLYKRLMSVAEISKR